MQLDPKSDATPEGRGLFIGGIVAVIVVGTGFFYHLHQMQQPKRDCVEALAVLNERILRSEASISDLVKTPQFLEGSTNPEIEQIMSKSLRNEISAEGIELLRRKGKFGPLSDICPDRGARWAQTAGVSIHECLAFRVENSGREALAVFWRKSDELRLIRIDNVNHEKLPLMALKD